MELFVTEPVVIIHSVLDDYIPFNRFMVIPYLLWFPWIPVTVCYFYFIAPKGEFWRFALPLYTGMAMCVIGYAIVPNGLNLRPDVIEGEDFCAWVVRTIQGVDPPMNVCPSLHVLVTLGLMMAWLRSKTPFVQKHKAWIFPLSILLGVSILASTVMMKQHSIIDVFAAIALFAVLDIAMCGVVRRVTEYANS